MVYKPLHPCQNDPVNVFGFVILCICNRRLTDLNHSGKAMGIEVELLIAAADILLALLVAVSLPAREEIT